MISFSIDKQRDKMTAEWMSRPVDSFKNKTKDQPLVLVLTSMEQALTFAYRLKRKLLNGPILGGAYNFKKNYSDIAITDSKDNKTKGNAVAKIKYLSGKSYGNYEAVSYINAGKTGVMIIMPSRTKDEFENSLIAFESLVKSYLFMADEVIIDKKD